MLRFNRVVVDKQDFRLSIDRLNIEKVLKCYVIGPSGSGKSTFLRLVAGLDSPSSGEFYVNGEAGFGSVGMGLLQQDLGLWPHLTCLQHIQLVRRKGTATMSDIDYLDQCELKNMEQTKPSNMSGGQQQRLAVARALAASRDLLLLDEPFCQLDKVTSQKIERIVDSYIHANNIMTIEVTHDVDNLSDNDFVVVIEDGNIKCDGNWLDVKQSRRSPWVSAVMNLYK